MDDDNILILKCTVTRGLGEGTFFMSIAQYKKEIKNKLGFDSYPGTLNLKINKKQIDILKGITAIRINGFKSGNKLFGGIRCYRAKIKSVHGSIIIPDMNKHKEDVIEFIAPVHVRSQLNLNDGGKIDLELLKEQ